MQKIVTFNFEDLLIYNVYLKYRVQMAAAFVCPCAKIRVLGEGDKGGLQKVGLTRDFSPFRHLVFVYQSCIRGL